ncbi:gas vesicle protein GvpN [Aquisphaera insulae]|uniref:gas vesicle protein GvpN n=1 Tax=Aquisphaera insulae TaxID=2712864 RepID=UPI002030B6F1|nr:gas vesicle protein GvpN [Aquisphaera insulae]
MNAEDLSLLALKQKPDFVETPVVRSLCERATSYLNAGYPIHFSGPAGTGKTTLAMHAAAKMGRPVALIHGDDEYGSSDLVGGQLGYRSTRVVDNFIHSVMKTEENVAKTWVDHRLTNACKYGFTVIYDEFNRSRPEANNVLLAILEERLLEMPSGRVNEGYISVHPNFRAIFTSNPEEYAGVHKTQDALLDRMITITVGQYDRETEVEITAAKSGLARADAERIVDIVREFRGLGVHQLPPTVRASIMIARVASLRGASIRSEDPIFRETCRDVLRIDAIKVTREGTPAASTWLDEILDRNCATAKNEARRRSAPARGLSLKRQELEGAEALFSGNGLQECKGFDVN